MVDETGELVAKRRIDDDTEGCRCLVDMLAEAGDNAVASDPRRGGNGPWAAALLSAHHRPGGVSINSMDVARYRQRSRVARAKSDHADAMALANILRTEAEAHRPLPEDSELVQAIAVLARVQQDAVWNRSQLSNQLRSHLKQYFSAALAVFQIRGIGLDSREARAVLAVAPDPAAAARLITSRLRTVLRKSGRQRNIDVWAEQLRGIFASEYLHQLPLVEQAMGRQTQALVRQLGAACHAADDLAEATTEAFAQHPDAEILASFPGIVPFTGLACSARSAMTAPDSPVPGA